MPFSLKRGIKTKLAIFLFFLYALYCVSIKLVDGTTQEKTIVGRTNNSLITIDDELIDVSKISQIDFLD